MQWKMRADRAPALLIKSKDKTDKDHTFLLTLDMLSMSADPGKQHRSDTKTVKFVYTVCTSFSTVSQGSLLK